MKLCALFVAAVASLATAKDPVIIDHDKIIPFPEPDPVTSSQKAAVKFKPQLRISEGCHPYPAVQEDGSVSGGLERSGRQDGDCTGSKLGSQIYARSAWFNNMWAIMYVWYFPKGRRVLFAPLTFRLLGNRHNWEYIVLWLDNPDIDNPDINNCTIIEVTISSSLGYATQPRHPKSMYMVGTSVRVEYYYNYLVGTTALRVTDGIGEFQDLITWDQLSKSAQHSLSLVDWDDSTFNLAGHDMPLIDGVFEEMLDKTYPF